MKLRAIIAAIVASAASSILVGTCAVAAQAAPKAGEMLAAKAGASNTQPHSHLQQKTGMIPQQKSATATADQAEANQPTAIEGSSAAPAAKKSSSAKRAKTKADKDKSKHFHPRDGK